MPCGSPATQGGRAWRAEPSRVRSGRCVGSATSGVVGAGMRAGAAASGTVLDHHAVAEADHALRMLGEPEVVRDDDHRGAGLLVELVEQGDDLRARRAVEIARRLVGKQDARLVGEGAGDGHALLFAARELAGEVVQTVAEPHARQQVARLLAGVAAAPELQRDLHILLSGERGNKLKRLENEPNFLPTQAGPCVLIEARQVLAVQQDGTPRGLVEAREQAEQRRLAASRGSDDGNECPAGDVE